ncbi:hypothetical protein J437_LFUL008646, partial [Ladona fulva]
DHCLGVLFVRDFCSEWEAEGRTVGDCTGNLWHFERPFAKTGTEYCMIEEYTPSASASSLRSAAFGRCPLWPRPQPLGARPVYSDDKDSCSAKLFGVAGIAEVCLEMALIKTYAGDVQMLGTAEKFYLELSEVTEYDLRIEAMAQMEEFEPAMTDLQQQLKKIKTTCNDLITNKSLKKINLEELEKEVLSLAKSIKTLRKKIDSSKNEDIRSQYSDFLEGEWLEEFLERGGLGALLESLEELSSKRKPQDISQDQEDSVDIADDGKRGKMDRGVRRRRRGPRKRKVDEQATGAVGFGMADALSQVKCVSCLRQIVNSRAGLQCIVEHPEHTRQLAVGLTSSNISVKMNVLELLCAVCMYSSRGLALVLDALNHLKASSGFRNRFGIILEAFKGGEAIASTALAFINCLLTAIEPIHKRVALRNEILALGLPNILSQLREEPTPDVSVQLDAFDTRWHSDAEELPSASVFLESTNSGFLHKLRPPHELFQIIFENVRILYKTLIFGLILKWSAKAEIEVDVLVESSKEMTEACNKLAIHFCEDVAKFKPGDCFKLFADFFDSVEKASKENEQRKLLEKKLAQRKIELEKKASKDETNNPNNPGFVRLRAKPRKIDESEDLCIVDKLMAEIRSGNFKLRRSITIGNS